MSLSSLKKITEKQKKRVGRGVGSGKGSHTSGRGQKGQTSRSGNQIRAGFEGGQNPLSKRLPRKRGIRISSTSPSHLLSPRKREIIQVSLSVLNKFKDGEVINEKVIRELKKVKSFAYIKVIDSGELKSKVTIDGIKVTKGAKIKIEKAGGKVI